MKIAKYHLQSAQYAIFNYSSPERSVVLCQRRRRFGRMREPQAEKSTARGRATYQALVRRGSPAPLLERWASVPAARSPQYRRKIQNMDPLQNCPPPKVAVSAGEAPPHPFPPTAPHALTPPIGPHLRRRVRAHVYVGFFDYTQML